RGELIEVGFANDYGAGIAEFLDDGSGALRRVSESRTGGGRGDSGNVDVVLNGEWNAIERKRFSGLERHFELGKLRIDLRGSEDGDPDAFAIIRCDARHHTREHIARSAFAGSVTLDERRDIQIVPRFRQHVTTPRPQGHRRGQWESGLPLPSGPACGSGPRDA